MQLTEFPRTRLAHLPTPLELLPRLSDHLGGPRIWVKRDDQTGLAGGGNKARKLEFLVADALAQQCDTLVTTGGVQSNHARQTAAAAARLGLACELLLPRLVNWHDQDYEEGGNVLLDRLVGADVHLLPADAYRPATFEEAIARLRAAGRRPYFIPIGGSTPLGALGYVAAADELLAQADALGLRLRAIVVGTGSGGTHAGLAAGLARAGRDIALRGIAVSGTSDQKRTQVAQLATEALAMLNHTPARLDQPIAVDDRFVGPGYGLPTDDMLEAVRLVAQLEGLLLDPVYTGKAMAGLIAVVRSGEFAPADNVVFWHTGGTPALFAYPSLFR